MKYQSIQTIEVPKISRNISVTVTGVGKENRKWFLENKLYSLYEINRDSHVKFNLLATDFFFKF